MRGAQFVTLPLLLLRTDAAVAADPPQRLRSDPPPIVSSWDDLLEGVQTQEDWQARRQVLKQRYLDLIRDDRKPVKPPLDLQVHETADVEGIYRRQLVSYNVEQDERAHAYVGIPLEAGRKGAGHRGPARHHGPRKRADGRSERQSGQGVARSTVPARATS